MRRFITSFSVVALVLFGLVTIIDYGISAEEATPSAGPVAFL